MNSISPRWRSQSLRIRSSLSGGSGGTAPWRAAESCMARSESAKVAGRSARVPSRNDSSGTGASLRVPESLGRRGIRCSRFALRLVHQRLRVAELAELGGGAAEEEADGPVRHEAEPARGAGHHREVV